MDSSENLKRAKTETYLDIDLMVGLGIIEINQVYRYSWILLHPTILAPLKLKAFHATNALKTSPQLNN